MSSRNRGRGNNNQDTDEERRLWKEIKDKAAEVDTMVVSYIIPASFYLPALFNFFLRWRPSASLAEH